MAPNLGSNQGLRSEVLKWENEYKRAAEELAKFSGSFPENWTFSSVASKYCFTEIA